jgi:uncharacterized protein (TIGR02246 family)
VNPADIHPAVESAFNAGDVDALVALYEPDAVMVGEDGDEAHGVDAIRAVWSALIALGGTIAVTTRQAVVQGEVALLSNRWDFSMDGAVVASAITSEVARRQPDGSWKYVIDNPYGAPAD